MSEEFLKNFGGPRYFLLIMIVAAIYFGAAKLGLSLAFINANVSPVWPPTGLAIAAVLLLGYRIWPGVLVGAFLANLFTPISMGTAGCIAIGNTLEALSAGLILRSLNFHSSFDHAKDVFKFVVVAIFCTMGSATIGNLSLYLSHAAAWQDFGDLWLTWWLGDSIGALLVAPLLLAWSSGSRHWLPRKRYLEASLLLLLLAGAATATFGGPFTIPLRYYPIAGLTIPFLLWAAFRLGPRGVTLATITISVFALWGTAHGLGPFVGRTPNESLLLLQVFLGSNAVIFLFLVATVEERRFAAEVLLENQERTHAIMQTAVDGIVTMDYQGRIVDFNPAAERIFGYCSSDVIGRALADVIIPPEMREQYRRGLDHYLAAGESPIVGKQIEINGLRADGSLVLLELSIARMTGGELPMFTGFLRDITERQQMEEARTRLAAIIESSDDAIIGETLEGIITSWNRGAEALFGYSTEAAVGKPMAMLIPADRANEEPEILARIARGEDVDHFETVRVGKGGRQIDVSVSISPIKDTHDKIIGVSKIARDITERKRAEEALRESEERYRLLFETNPHPMWVYDVETFSFLAVNEAAICHYGYSREEFLQMTIKNIHLEEEIPALIKNVSKPRGGFDKAGEFRHRKKGGSIIDVEIICHQLIFAGRRAELVLANDVSEHKKADAALQRAEMKYRSIFENAIEGIYQCTPEGRFLSVNRSLARILGYESPEELIAQRSSIETEHYVDPNCRIQLERILRKRDLVGFEYEVFTKKRKKDLGS